MNKLEWLEKIYNKMSRDGTKSILISYNDIEELYNQFKNYEETNTENSNLYNIIHGGNFK